jgi:hypothetical protein
MRRWHGWLLAALLLGAAALLLSGEDEPRRAVRKEVEFPTWLREPERERAAQRATLTLPAAPAATPAGAAPEPPPRRDPFLVALPVRPGDPVIVMEANALRHSRLGERFVACALERDPDAFARLERQTGIDLLKDVDRLAMVADAVVVSGFFERARWDGILAPGVEPEAYGAGGRLCTYGKQTVGAWGDHLVVVADDPAQVRRAIDQLEGRAPVPEAGIPEEMAYGEMYGVVPGAAARKLLGDDPAASATGSPRWPTGWSGTWTPCRTWRRWSACGAATRLAWTTWPARWARPWRWRASMRRRPGTGPWRTSSSSRRWSPGARDRP